MLLCWCAFYLIYHVSPELHSRPSFLAPPLPFLPSLYLPPASPPPRSSTHLIPEKLSIKWDALACDYFSVLGIWYKKAKAPALLLQHFLIIVLIENLYRPLSLSHSHTHTHTHTLIYYLPHQPFYSISNYSLIIFQLIYFPPLFLSPLPFLNENKISFFPPFCERWRKQYKDLSTKWRTGSRYTSMTKWSTFTTFSPLSSIPTLSIYPSIYI